MRDKAKLPTSIKLHHLRHTVMTLLDECGASETLKAAIVGHEKKSVTQQYTHVSMRRVLETVWRRVVKKAA